MSKQTTNKQGETVKCSKALIPRKHFWCPRNKKGNKFPGLKKCIGCTYAVWTKETQKNKSDILPVGGMCFMIELYRSSNQGSSSFDRHTEICRDCAKKEIKDGYYVEYDLYLSERTDAIKRDDTCQICEGSFFVDGRKKWKRLDGAVY